MRVSEVVRLKLPDIESERGLIRVEQGKGRQDRYTLLSTRLLTELRAYWHLYQPAQWVFTGLDAHTPMPIGTAGGLPHRPSASRLPFSLTEVGWPGLSRMIQSPYGYTVSVGQKLSATTFYPSWGTTMDKMLFVRHLGGNMASVEQDLT